jgi:hypothetical protein
MKSCKHIRQQTSACHAWLHRQGYAPFPAYKRSIVLVVLPQEAEEVAAEKNRTIVAARNADIRYASTAAK